MIEKVLSSKSLHKGYFLEFVEDKVEVPTDPPMESSRQYFVHPGGVCIVPVLENGDLVMVKQYRGAIGKIIYEFPAGKIDKGEEPFETAQRELKEETGYSSDDWQNLGGIYPCPGYCTETLFMFIARDCKAGTQNLDPGELVELCTMTKSEALQKVSSGEIRDAKTIAGLMFLLDPSN